MLFRLIQSVSDAEEPGQNLIVKWATATNYTWVRQKNQELMECYYNSSPNERGYMKPMRDL